MEHCMSADLNSFAYVNAEMIILSAVFMEVKIHDPCSNRTSYFSSSVDTVGIAAAFHRCPAMIFSDPENII